MKNKINKLLIVLLSAHLSLALAQATNAEQAQQLQNLLQAAKQQQPPQQVAEPISRNSSVSAQTQTTHQPGTIPTTTTTMQVNESTQSQLKSPGEPDAAVEGVQVNAVDTGGNLRDEAFASMAQSQLPMSPDQIRTFRKLFDETQRAVAEYPGVPPEPTSSSIVVNLTPGATPPVIRLQAGFVTALVFVDATGASWPVKAIDIGDPQGFDVQWDQKSNTLLVQALTQYRTANLAVLLRGLNTPIMLTLIPGQTVVDYRVDLHVPALGPNALPIQIGLPSTESPFLLNVLSGIPPPGSKTLDVEPRGYADVWLLGNQLYIRTRATVLSPAWISTISSSDGTHAYKMPVTPLIIVSSNGKPIDLSVAGY